MSQTETASQTQSASESTTPSESCSSSQSATSSQSISASRNGDCDVLWHTQLDDVAHNIHICKSNARRRPLSRTQSGSVTITPSATHTSSVTYTRSQTQTQSPSESMTSSQSASESPSQSQSASLSSSSSQSASITPSVSPSLTATPRRPRRSFSTAASMLGCFGSMSGPNPCAAEGGLASPGGDGPVRGVAVWGASAGAALFLLALLGL